MLARHKREAPNGLRRNHEITGLRHHRFELGLRLARQHDCPVVGARVTRLPGNRFRVAAIGPIEVPRDAEGDVDVAATTQLIMSTVEGWIRETPEQWLWFHRRWR